MKDKKYKDLLERLPQVLNDGLANIKFTEEMRQKVRLRLDRLNITDIKPTNKFFYAPAIGFLLLVICITFTSPWIIRRNYPIAQPEAFNKPTFIEQESKNIDMDGEEPLEMVSTLKVRESNRGDLLMALVWARDSHGQLNVVSTQSFKGNEFLPIEVLVPSTHKGNLVLIAATDENRQVYYRVLGYDGNRVLLYLERSSDFSDIRRQMLREIERLLPASIEDISY